MALTWRYLPSLALDERTGEEYWCIREVYQDEDTSGPFGGLSWIAAPMRPLGENYMELMRDVQHMNEAFVRGEYLDLRDPDSPRILKMGEGDG